MAQVSPHYPKAEDMVELPAVDMQGPEEDIIAQVYQQMTTLGFLQLKNIDGFDEDRLLADVKEFHSLPQEVKQGLYVRQFNQDNQNRFHGLFPLLDNDVSHKEFFDMGSPIEEADQVERTKYLVEETPMPQGEQYASLVARYRAHEAFARELGIKIASYLAVGLGKDRDFFKPWFERAPLSTFRTIHYPTRVGSNVRYDQLSEAEIKLTTPPHVDSGFITLLSTFSFPGLQVLVDGEYRSVKPLKNHIVVNLGATFERITNFTLKATWHQVMDIGVERFSCPFFLDPCSSAIIPSNILNENEDGVKPPIEFGKWLAKTMRRKYGEWKNAFPGLSDDSEGE